jgi:hypothetical protein
MEEEKEEKTPILSLIGGIVLIGIAIGLYFYLDGLEKEGGTLRINWIIALIYKIGGKLGASGIIAFLGLLTSFFAIQDMRAQK